MRKSYSPEFKAKVVREILKEEKDPEPDSGDLRDTSKSGRPVA